MPATKEILQEGRYRIGQQSNQFPHETVYDAYDTVRGANVIVKEISPTFGKAATTAQRESQKSTLASQAKLLTELKHEALLHVHDYFSEGDRQYLVMAAVDGDTLQELLKRNRRPFPMSDVLAWADQILDALNYLHTAAPPVIHKHIRPENTVLCSDGRIKLQGHGPELPGSDVATSADGNLQYAPLEMIWGGLDPASQTAIMNGIDERSERILKEPADARTDLYSLGATLYFLVTGQPPVGALERAIEVLDGNLDPLKEPTKLDPTIPPEISDVIMKSMEIRRENRYDAAAIMRQVLKTAQIRAAERLAAPADNSAPSAHQESVKPTVQDNFPVTKKPNIPTAPAASPATAEKIVEAGPVAAELASSEPAVRHAAKASDGSDDLPTFGSSEERTRAGISMPVVGIGAVVAIGIIGAVLFFIFSGSGGSTKPSSGSAAAQSQPVAPAPLPQTTALPDTSSASAATTSTEPAAAEPVEADARPGGRTAAQPAAAKTRKPAEAPAKPAAKDKKPVTVDDLINDN